MRGSARVRIGFSGNCTEPVRLNHLDNFTFSAGGIPTPDPPCRCLGPCHTRPPLPSPQCMLVSHTGLLSGLNTQAHPASRVKPAAPSAWEPPQLPGRRLLLATQVSAFLPWPPSLKLCLK